LLYFFFDFASYQDRGSKRLISLVWNDPNYFAFNTVLIYALFFFFYNPTSTQKVISVVNFILVLLLCSSLSVLIGFITSCLLVFGPEILRKFVNFVIRLFQSLKIKCLVNVSYPILIIILTPLLLISLAFIGYFFITSVSLFFRLQKYFDMYTVFSEQSMPLTHTLGVFTSDRSTLANLAFQVFNSSSFQNKLFGHGTTSYLYISGNYLHNTFLECLLEGGLVLFFLYLLTYLFTYFFAAQLILSPFQRVLVFTTVTAPLSLTLFYKPIYWFLLFVIITRQRRASSTLL